MDPQSLRALVLIGIALPFAMSAAVLGMLWYPATGIAPPAAFPGRDRLRRTLSGVLAPGLVLLIVQSTLLGLPAVPPREAIHMLPWILMMGLVLGAVEEWVRPWSHRMMLALGIVLVGVGVAMTWRGHWIGPAILIHAAGWLSFQRLARGSSATTALLPLGVWCAGAAVVLIATGSLKLAQLAAAGAMSLLGAFVISLPRPRVSISGTTLHASLAWIAALLAQGMAFGDTPRAVGFTYAIGAPVVGAALIAVLGSRLPRAWMAPAAAAFIIMIIAAIAAAVGHTPSTGYEG